MSSMCHQWVLGFQYTVERLHCETILVCSHLRVRGSSHPRGSGSRGRGSCGRGSRGRGLRGLGSRGRGPRGLGSRGRGPQPSR